MPAAPALRTAPRKTLIFHIGDHKTGSTSIQTAFAQQQVSLADAEIFYPAQIANNPLGHDCKNYESDKPNVRENARKSIRQISHKIRESEARYNLISAESFERVPAPLFKKIISENFLDTDTAIKVVAYVRPHAGRITSTFAERTKIGAQRVLEGDLQSFFEHSRDTREFFYLERFSGWRDAFGKNFLLRPMIRSSLHNGSVLDDFIRHAFATERFSIQGAFKANESLDLKDLMRLKVLQQHLLKDTSRALRLHLGWEFGRIVGHMPPPETHVKLSLHRSLAEEIRDTYLEDARSMDREFFQGNPILESDLHRAVEDAVSLPQSTDPADHLSRSEIRSLEILSHLVGGMLEAKDVEWPSFLHKKRIRDVRKARKAASAAE